MEKKGVRGGIEAAMAFWRPPAGGDMASDFILSRHGRLVRLYEVLEGPVVFTLPRRLVPPLQPDAPVAAV